MKKILILLAVILSALTSVAQTEESVPNRLLIKNFAGETKGYLLDYFDDISFACVEGDVLAKVKIKEVTNTYLSLSIVRTLECKSYRLMIVPTTVANQLDNDLKVIAYANSLDRNNVPVLTSDFSDWILPSYLIPESEYTLFTVGQDEYGTDAGVDRVPFVTPSPEITGNPHVESNVISTEPNSFTMAFYPNDDVRNYWVLAGEKGSIQEQYEASASQLGLANFSSMISTFGILCQGDFEYTWNDLVPNTDYEVFVAIADVNGWFAPYQMFRTSTLSLGGSGDAYVDINVESYAFADWDGVLLPTLSVSYVPNDQACGYRVALCSQIEYDLNPDGYNHDLCSEPIIPTSNWYHYSPDTCDYPIAQSVPVVILAAAKNADGVWGNVNTVRFTTPDSIEDNDSQPEANVKAAKKECSPIPAAFAKGILPKGLNCKPRAVVSR